MNIHPNWIPLFDEYGLTGLYNTALQNVRILGKPACPAKSDMVLNAFSVDPNSLKVVILGQDVYPQPGVATGYAFACQDGKQPSYKILMRELYKEYDVYDYEDYEEDPFLQNWVEQGVLLLNSALTCEQWKPGSHAEIWKPFMRQCMSMLNDLKIRLNYNSLIFVFLGKSAASYAGLISGMRHYKIIRHHPAAETHGTLKFEGFFNEVNQHLVDSSQTAIEWLIPKIRETHLNDLFPET